MDSFLTERFARLARIPGDVPVSFGSPGRVTMTIPRGPVDVRTISAVSALVRRHAALATAKRAMDTVVAYRAATLDLPMIEDAEALRADLAACNIAAQVSMQDATRHAAE